MSALLEVAEIIGVLVVVWFLLLGWKLLVPSRPRLGRWS
jgi:hypothetical protein